MKPLLYSALPLALATAALASPPEPLFFFDFNKPGLTEANQGSETAVLVFRSGERKEADLHGAPGSGVTGTPGDLALDNTASTAMGKEGVGGLASVKDAKLSAKSFTVTGWYKSAPDAMLGGGARLVEMVSEGGFFIHGGLADGSVWISLNRGDTPLETSAFEQTGTWIFFAVTYDSESGTLAAYQGSPTEPVSEASNKVLSAGEIKLVHTPLMLLNSGNFERSFKGWLDNFRLFASEQDGSGALSATDLEEIRQQDLKVP